MTSDTRVLKSYVWHGDKCYFVSTIERDSSACTEPPARRYNETIVWDYDWTKDARGELLGMAGDGRGMIDVHLEIIRRIFREGFTPETCDFA